MDPAQRTRWIQLGVLSVILIAVVYFVLLPSLSTPTIQPGPFVPAGRAQAKTAIRPIDVRLDALGKAVAAEDPTAARRNPFRMGAATPPPPPEGTIAARGPAKPVTPLPPVPVGPPQPPPPPPIPYRFIGVLSGVPGQGRIAVLTDGRTVVHGRVNEIIEGRYRIVQIGEESLQIEHADGRGRQTIRLLGQ